MLGFQQFIGDDDMTAELVDEGRELVKRGGWKGRGLELGEGGGGRRVGCGGRDLVSSVILYHPFLVNGFNQ